MKKNKIIAKIENTRRFRTAWEISRNAAERFGGKAKEYFAVALKQVWAEEKPTYKATQKTIAAVLDRAAARADMIGANPASFKQIWFLSGLMFKKQKDASDWDMDNSNAILTKKAASEAIDFYLNH